MSNLTNTNNHEKTLTLPSKGTFHTDLKKGEGSKEFIEKNDLNKYLQENFPHDPRPIS